MSRSDDEALADYLLAAETLVAHLEDTNRGPRLQVLIDNCAEARDRLFYAQLDILVPQDNFADYEIISGPAW